MRKIGHHIFDINNRPQKMWPNIIEHNLKLKIVKIMMKNDTILVSETIK